MNHLTFTNEDILPIMYIRSSVKIVGGVLVFKIFIINNQRDSSSSEGLQGYRYQHYL